MTRLTELTLQHVETMPAKLELGILYVSLKYQTTIHLCACGSCGWETVLPFRNPATGWVYTEVDGKVTMRPSVGNQKFPCNSHYYITENKIDWL